ncbi:Ankyrin repeat-containing protein YAR1 [Pseudozyma hubeiensis]|nr:Ankyrin repeat-containing protein YAR1 [Pseudozyma hubeiensis]
MSNKAASLTSDQIDELLLSARYGDLEDLQASLSPLLSTSSPSSPSELLATIKNEDSNTLLHYASANGHLEVVQYLLPFSDLSLSLAQNVSGNTPLHWAGLNGHLDTVKLLVSHISKLESEHPEEAKKLNLIFHPKTPSKPDAAEGGEDDGSERKLWDVRNNAGRGPMSEAQMREQEAVVKFLLESMIDGPQGSTLQPAEPLPSNPKEETEAVEKQAANLNLNE